MGLRPGRLFPGVSRRDGDSGQSGKKFLPAKTNVSSRPPKNENTTAPSRHVKNNKRLVPAREKKQPSRPGTSKKSYHSVPAKIIPRKKYRPMGTGKNFSLHFVSFLCYRPNRKSAFRRIFPTVSSFQKFRQPMYNPDIYHAAV